MFGGEDGDIQTAAKANKRTFIEALREYSSQQPGPSPNKRVTVDTNETDTIRVEVNKVYTSFFVSQPSSHSG